MFCYSETKDLKETKTVDDSVKKLVPMDGKFQVAGLTITVDEDAYPDSDWFHQATWGNITSYTHYFKQLKWLLTTNTIFSEDSKSLSDEEFKHEQVLSCGLFVTRDSVPFQLKVRMTTDRDSYESTQVIAGRVLLTELSNKKFTRRIYPRASANQTLLDNYMLRQSRKRCHCKIDE